MSEDVSATMRVGITVILVAALVATVLNLMVMSNSILSNGQTTLQSGVDSVSTQEFSTYNNTKVSGTQVSTALSLFQGRDVGIIIQPTASHKLTGTNNGATYGINYGALFTTDCAASNGTANFPAIYQYSSSGKYNIVTSGSQKVLPSAISVPTTTAETASTFLGNYCTSTAKSVCFASIYQQSATSGYSVIQNNGEPYFTGQLHNTNGLVDANYDTVNTTILGNAGYLLSSSRFTSVLVKDPTGSIIGIVFKQIA